jgi:hypothetical protein
MLLSFINTLNVRVDMCHLQRDHRNSMRDTQTVFPNPGKTVFNPGGYFIKVANEGGAQLIEPS